MTTTHDALRGALSELAALRAAMSTLQTAKRAADAAHAAQFSDLTDAINETATRTLVADEQVRALTLALHDMTGEKKPVEGASVVIRTSYSYDAAVALAWAETALPTAITRELDTKAIDKIASTGTLPFATKIETPSVQIATDLSEYVVIPEPTHV